MTVLALDGGALADYLAEQTGLRMSDRSVYRYLRAVGVRLSRPQHHHEAGPGVRAQEMAVEHARDRLKPGEVFYYADEFNVSWYPTLRALWGPTEQQVRIRTLAHPTRHYRLGAVNWHAGEMVVLTRRRKRRQAGAEWRAALLV